jgi:hypothetical protein
MNERLRRLLAGFAVKVPAAPRLQRRSGTFASVTTLARRSESHPPPG